MQLDRQPALCNQGGLQAFFPPGHMSEICYQGGLQEFWNHLPEKIIE